MHGRCERPSHQSALVGTALALLLPACASAPSWPHAPGHESEAPALPRAGDRTLTVGAYGGIPVLQKSFFWDGNGETDEAGVKARHLWFLSDRIALGGGLTASVWFPSGHDILAGELEAVGRWYFFRGESLGVFVEGATGYVHSTDPIPPKGTEWNFTFSFGPGVDVPIAKNFDLIGTTIYHHISNALGRPSPQNPSQNEVQILLGVAWRF